MTTTTTARRTAASTYVGVPTLLDLLPEWVAWLRTRGHSARGVRTYEKEACYLVAALGGDVATAADLTWERLQLHLSDLAERGLSASSLGKRVSVARSLCDWLRKAGHLDRNVADDLDAPKRRRGLPRPLNTIELHSLWALMQTPIEQIAPARRWDWQRNMRVLALGLFAGLRLSEIARLRWRDVDLDAGVIEVISGKGDKDRRVPIAVDLEPFLATVPFEERKAQQAVAGRRDGECYSYKSVSHVMDRFVREALPDVSMHRLRHSFATRVYAASRDLLSLQQLLGHASSETTQIYTLVDLEQRRSAIDKLPSLSGAAPRPRSAEPAAPVAGADHPTLRAIEALRARFAPAPPLPPRPAPADVCAQCGAPIAPARTCPSKRFCSTSCGVTFRRAEARAARPPKPPKVPNAPKAPKEPTLVPCQGPGCTEMVLQLTRGRPRQYCSGNCRTMAYYARQKGTEV